MYNIAHLKKEINPIHIFVSYLNQLQRKNNGKCALDSIKQLIAPQSYYFQFSHKWLNPGAYVDLPDLLCRAARHLATFHLATSQLATCHLAAKLSDHNPPHSILQQQHFQQQ